MLHHNMPYPAIDPLHGKPLVVFDRGLYAAINFHHISHDYSDKMAKADGAAYESWAEDMIATKDFRYNLEGVNKADLAKAMVVVGDKSMITLPKMFSFLNQHRPSSVLLLCCCLQS